MLILKSNIGMPTLRPIRRKPNTNFATPDKLRPMSGSANQLKSRGKSEPKWKNKASSLTPELIKLYSPACTSTQTCGKIEDGKLLSSSKDWLGAGSPGEGLIN